MTPQLSHLSPAGELVLDFRGVVYLPEHNALLVSDLHLEKGSYHRAKTRAPIPVYDTVDTIARLRSLIDEYAPAEVYALGDSFHDTEAGQRMTEMVRNDLNEITHMVERFTWILGNHDPDIPKGLIGEQAYTVSLGGFLLSHEPMSMDGQFNVCGHFHPKIELKTRAGKQRLPCFITDKRRMIMPSFGTFTGGLSIEDDAITAQFASQRSIYAMARRGLLRVS